MNNKNNIVENDFIKSREFDFGTIALRHDGILVFEPSKNITTVCLKDLKIMLNGLVELCENKPKPFFSNNRQLKSLGSEEREFVGRNLHLFATKTAIIEDSSIVRFITYMIAHLHKPEIPMKMFKNENEAIQWLKLKD